MADLTTFPVRGFHLDLRIQAMTTRALHRLAAELAGFGINTLIMEWEGTFPFDRHAVIRNRNAYTVAEVKSFISRCTTLGIEVIPLQQCFGHVEYILSHDRYRRLREEAKDPSQVCPLRVGEATALFKQLFREVAALHPSRYFHIGCDETMLLGHCERCRPYEKKHGRSRLFADYVAAMCTAVRELGKVPVLWADVILQYPEAAARLPAEAVFINWNYGWKADHFGPVKAVRRRGRTVWGAPSLRSAPDNYYLTQWAYHLNNLRDFIPYARRTGYQGMILTSWSTSGEYGYEYDRNQEIIALHPIRRVYPLSGFRILLAAYARALSQEKPLDPAAFVREYGRERFGFTGDESREFWKALQAQEICRKLRPRKNQWEFAHFLLMADLRAWYLRFKEIEAGIESGRFRRKDARPARRRLVALKKAAVTLDSRFSRLQKGFLESSEIEEENRNRVRKLNIVLENLNDS